MRNLPIGAKVNLVSKNKRTTYMIVQYGKVKALGGKDETKTIRTYQGKWYEVEG